MKFSALIFGLSILFSTPQMSCQKGNGAEGDKPLVALDMKKVAYGPDTIQNMDVYLPANRDTANTKVILFIHGGGWNSGDKNDFNVDIGAIRKDIPDYAVFNINYHLAANGTNRFPVQISDIDLALNYIESQALQYKINTNKICLIGASAGAHLALLYAYKNNRGGKIKAIIDLFGPADLTDMYNNHPIPLQARPVLVNFLGTTPAANPEIYRDASPVNFINAQSVPTRIFHGGADIVVPIKQSTALKDKLQANNVKVEMTTYSTEGHGWYGNNLLDTYVKAVKFIKENVY
jgi:acetyl esterase/lipase